MLNKKIEKAINAQITEEVFSAHIYLSMSSWFETQNLKGFANWMYVQYQEELTHAIKFFRYVNDRGGQAIIDTIKGPESDWKNPVLAFKETLKHEQFVTKKINELVYLAKEEKDYATESFLKWYVDEQVEEEKNATDILNELNMIGESKTALLMLDKELGARTFVDPTKTAE